MKLTQAQKQKQLEKSSMQVDKATIILIVVVLVVSIVVGVTVGKLLYDLAMANA